MGWRSDQLTAWLQGCTTDNGDYRHCRLEECAGASREDGLEALREVVERAHEDARDRLQALTAINLNPIGQPPPPASVTYPADLHTTTLQGYLGEIMAGVVAENFAPHAREWEVPAFLFRAHVGAFQALERRRQLGGPATPIPGRTGDDCVAFVRDDDGEIAEWLMCEAKCSHDHASALIRQGHKQLSVPLRVPVDLLQLIDILKDSTDPEAADWIDAIRLLLHQALAAEAPERFDLFMYVCGRAPINESNWIPSGAPHEDYAGNRPLEAVEFHLDDFDEALEHIYPGHEVQR